MKSYLQRFIIWLGPFIPFFIRHFFYLLPLIKVKSFVFFLGIEAWSRNSVYFKEEVFGLSDLDITLYSHKKVTSFKRNLILFYLKVLRWFFPFVGEVIIYEEDSVKDFMPLASSLELKRDPILVKKMGIQYCVNELREAFILNWMYNDYHRMDQSILKRRNKIDRFRLLLNLESKSYFSSEDLLMDLLKDFIKDPEECTQWFEALQKFLRAIRIEKRPINNWLDENKKYEEIIALCYPQLWMGAAIHNETFYEILHRLKNHKDEHKNIFAAQISWELWGLYSNHTVTSFSGELALHLDHLKECISKVLERDDLSQAIDNLRGLYERD